MSIVVGAADETDDERDTDGVLLSSCNLRSKGDGCRSKSTVVSGLFLFFETGFLRIDLNICQHHDFGNVEA
jgi:hypothetical protein